MNNVKSSRRNFLRLTGALVFMTPGLSHAQVLRTQSISEEQIALRINLSGRQRMLSQRIAKAIAMIKLGISQEDMLAQINAAYTDFSEVLLGFRAGEGDSGITKERNVKTQLALREVESLWADFRIAIENVISTGKVGDEQFDIIIANNIDLRNKSNDVVKALVDVYGGTGEIAPQMAISIDIAGRQRMLTQKMSKEVALITLSHNVDQNQQDFNNSTSLFGESLTALINGGTSFITLETPNEQTMTSLKRVASNWSDVQPFVASTNAGNTPDRKTTEEFVQKAELLLKDSNQAVLSYQKAAKPTL